MLWRNHSLRRFERQSLQISCRAQRTNPLYRQWITGLNVMEAESNKQIARMRFSCVWLRIYGLDPEDQRSDNRVSNKAKLNQDTSWNFNRNLIILHRWIRIPSIPCHHTSITYSGSFYWYFLYKSRLYTIYAPPVASWLLISAWGSATIGDSGDKII